MSENRSAPVPTLLWRERTSSTQDDARELLATGAARAPLAVATDDQRGGRGRLGRAWTTPPGAGLALTVAWKPTTPIERRTWYPLVTGLGVIDALAASTGLTPHGRGGEGGIGLKWPNDVHDSRGRKLAGILVEADPAGRLLIGIGINRAGEVRDADGRPVEGAVTLEQLIGRPPQGARELARRVADAVAEQLSLLDAAGGDALVSGQADRYRETCVTTGLAVRVTGIGDREDVVGRAAGIDAAGRLLIEDSSGSTRAVDVGDVHHVRPAASPRDAV